MSHFYTIVLVNKDTESELIEREVGKLLAPFNENLEMERYVEYTKAELIENSKAEVQEYAKTGCYAKYLQDPEGYEAKYGRNQNHIRYIKDEFPKKLNWTDEQHYQDAVKYYDPENVGRFGEVYSTYNPCSKWDWYSIGGRWDGVVKNNPQESEDGGFNFGDKYRTLENNLTTVNDLILRKEYPFAIVTPDGEWFESGDMGWWGMVTDEKPEETWHDQCDEIYSKYSDCFAVGCDLHI